MAQNSLVGKLLSEGHEVFIKKGQVNIRPKSNCVIFQDWLNNHKQQITAEISTQTGIPIFAFISHKVGNFAKRKKGGGIAMQFKKISNGEPAYTIFNVNLNRKRKSKLGEAGSPFPEGQFGLTKDYDLYKLWGYTGLPIPKPSCFHDRMGNLKKILFTGPITKGEKLTASLLRPVEITYQQILQAFEIHGVPNNYQTSYGQLPDNYQTSPPYKQSSQNHLDQGFQPNSSTVEKYYGISKQGSTGIRGSVISVNTLKRPQDQSIEEWLADYNNAK